MNNIGEQPAPSSPCSPILSIDPGNKQSAFVIWNGVEILEKAILPNEELLLSLNRIHVKAPTMVIEKVCSYGMAVGETIFDTVFWTGRYCQRWGCTGWERIPRLNVKLHLCHQAKAKDSNIRQALIDRFGEPGTKNNQGLTYGLSKDMWAAFALAVYAVDNRTCIIAR